MAALPVPVRVTPMRIRLSVCILTAAMLAAALPARAGDALHQAAAKGDLARVKALLAAALDACMRRSFTRISLELMK